MPATFGVTNLHSLAPATGHAHESSADAAIEVATLRDSLGVTVVAKPKKLITRSITLSGKGTANFGDVAAGAITKGASFVTSVKVTESNDDFPSFEIQAVAYEDIYPPPIPMPAAFNEIGVKCVTAALVESVDVQKQVEHKIIKKNDGAFETSNRYDPSFEFEINQDDASDAADPQRQAHRHRAERVGCSITSHPRANPIRILKP